MNPLINKALLKEQIKRFWSIGALTLLAYAFFVLLPLYKPVGTPYELRNQINDLVRLLSMRNPIMVAASILAPLTASLTMFSYLFQTKATTAIHALPLNKRQIFCTNITAGILLMGIPLLILCAFLLIPITSPGANTVINGVRFEDSGWIINSFPAALFPKGLSSYETINTFPVVAGFFARAFVTMLFYYAVCVLAVFAAGNIVVAVLFAGVIPLIPVGLFMLFQLIGIYYVFGYNTDIVSDQLVQIVLYTNPLGFMMCYDTAYFTLGEAVPALGSSVVPAWRLFVVYGATIAALFGSAYYCGCTRRQERAGDSIVFTALKNVLVFLLSLLGMITMGLFMVSMLRSILAMYIGFAIGFVLAYFIAQMIAEKALNVLHKAKGLLVYGGIVLALFLVVVGCTRFDLFGYANYVPADEDVTGVYLGGAYEYYSMRGDNDVFFFVENPAIIADTLTVHRDIVYNQNALRKTYLDAMFGNRYVDSYNQDILYQLKDGRVIARSYRVPMEFAQKDGVNLQTLKDNEEVILSYYHSFKAPDRIENIIIECNVRKDEQSQSQYYSAMVTKQEDIRSLLEAVKKDIILSRQVERERQREREAADEALKGPVAEGIPQVDTAASFIPENWYGYVKLKNQPYQRAHFSLEYYENTKVWLLEKGYITFEE